MSYSHHCNCMHCNVEGPFGGPWNYSYHPHPGVACRRCHLCSGFPPQNMDFGFESVPSDSCQLFNGMSNTAYHPYNQPNNSRRRVSAGHGIRHKFICNCLANRSTGLNRTRSSRREHQLVRSNGARNLRGNLQSNGQLDETTAVSERRSDNSPNQSSIMNEEAVRAYNLEKQWPNADHKMLMIKFPDTEINQDIVKSYHPMIQKVHFRKRFTQRCCYVTLKDECNTNDIINELNKKKFGNGFLTVTELSSQNISSKMVPKNLDPLTIFVGNLALHVLPEEVKALFPKYNQMKLMPRRKQKDYKTAFVTFNSAADAFEAFQQTAGKKLQNKSLMLKFRRLQQNSVRGQIDGDPEIVVLESSEIQQNNASVEQVPDNGINQASNNLIANEQNNVGIGSTSQANEENENANAHGTNKVPKWKNEPGTFDTSDSDDDNETLIGEPSYRREVEVIEYDEDQKINVMIDSIPVCTTPIPMDASDDHDVIIIDDDTSSSFGDGNIKAEDLRLPDSFLREINMEDLI